VALCDTTVKNGNMGVHNYSPSGAQQPQRYLGKFTSSMTFGAHKLVHAEPFLDYLYELMTIAISAIYMWKKITFSTLNHCSGFFFKSLSYLYEVGSTNILADFWTFAIFRHNFAKILAPPSGKNKNCIVLLKGQSPRLRFNHFV